MLKPSRRWSSFGGSGSLPAACAALALLFTSCGGGGGGGGGPPLDPPTGLVYALPSATYEAEVAVAPNTPSHGGGAVALYSVLPSLPAGLVIDPGTGVITGAAASMTPSAVYTVHATNADGEATAPVTIAVTLNQGDDMSPKATFTDDDIRYFMGRTQFGGTTAMFNTIKAMGVPAFVDQMVNFTVDATLDGQCDALLLNPATDPAGLEGKFPSTTQLQQYWLTYMTRTSNPFQEVLAFFWHDHFAASDTVLQDGGMNYWVKDHINMFRLQGNGNLRAFLLNMARDWLMLTWLNGIDSTKGAPNENFGREFWELFTLGVDNGYSQADIVQAAKAFTGYQLNYNLNGLQTISFNTGRHDSGSKTFFGQTIAAQNSTDDYQRVVDITLDNRPVAEFISKCLFEYFCFLGPKTIPTGAMASTMRGGNYELKPVLRQLFKSKAFFSSKARAGLVKGQVDHIVGFIRSTGLQYLDGQPANQTLSGQLFNIGQVPTQPPTVNGWPQGELLLSAQGMLDRANVVNELIKARVAQAAAGIDLRNLLPPAVLPATSPTSAAVVDALCDLLHVSASATEKTTYATYLDTNVSSLNGVPFAETFDVNVQLQIDTKVRGLLYMLTQHPSYATK